MIITTHNGQSYSPTANHIHCNNIEKSATFWKVKKLIIKVKFSKKNRQLIHSCD